ncbi:MAG: pullulanase-type alpha-1,6-glucosidase [Colwellia sp.]
MSSIKLLPLSILSCALISTSVLITACEDSTKPVVSAAEKIDTVSFSLDQLASLPSDSSAHWITPQLLLLPKSDENLQYSLVSENQQPLGAVALTVKELSSTGLTSTDLPEKVKTTFPHLSGFQAYYLKVSVAEAKKLLKQKLMVVATDKTQKPQRIAYLQTGAVLDALYTQKNNDANEVTDLGATVTEKGINFKLWAPTAQKVSVLLFNKDKTSHSQLAMVEDSNTGVWSVKGDAALNNAYYQYQLSVYHPVSKKIEVLTTTDPYSLSLSINSQYSQIVDLNNRDTQPENWQNHIVPTVKHIEDNVFYETHIRDFSADDKTLSDPDFRGKYKAFSEQKSLGIKHLKSLQAAGLNNIHLLPTFDIATVNEDANQTIDIYDTMAKVCNIAPETSICQPNSPVKVKSEQSLKSVLSSFDGNGEQAQLLVGELREIDNFNWGYDPYHYTVPEGSYAVNPEGVARLVEFREMVQSIHNLGFRVIMDVVYNHTHQSGLEKNAVLDKIVPNYYHRLDLLSGVIEQSTCCDNTATERVMMAKLMSDSLVVWARDYKIDGFRFDLMGHQPKAAMLNAREAVRQVDSDTYFYGEGWNFGEVANGRQFVQASQLELGGTEIGTYTDRLRDAVRGSGNNTRSTQGIGNGLLMQPNELQTSEKSQADYNLLVDQLRVGLAANLANFPLINSQGEAVLGKNVPYGDQPTGYALDPADTINYISKHDNQTLWDNSQYRIAFEVSTDDRVRMHVQSLSFALFAQGLPFLHMGSEFMRSKSFLRDSYDYGDWFNRVDFSKQQNFYNIGLPPAEKDKDNWPLIRTVLAGNQDRDRVTAKHIQFSSDVFTQMLAIRMSSPLFRLTSEQAVLEKLSFVNTYQKNSGKSQQAGLIVMKLDDTVGVAVDENYQGLMVIFNTSTKAQFFAYKTASEYQLHPVYKNGVDKVVKQSEISAKGFTVPALTSAVFVKK